jgi:hypothetical protein
VSKSGKSAKYSTSLVLPEGEYFLRAIAYKNSKPIGRILNIPRKELLKRAL